MTSAIPQAPAIYEDEIVSETRLLPELWTNDATFLFVSGKGGVTRSCLARAAETLPQTLQTGCFGILTSSSIGEPRLILGSKGRTEELVRVLHKLQNSEPVQETVCALPLSYSYAFVNQWVWAHVFGRYLRLTAGFAEPNTLKTALEQATNAQIYNNPSRDDPESLIRSTQCNT